MSIAHTICSMLPQVPAFPQLPQQCVKWVGKMVTPATAMPIARMTTGVVTAFLGIKVFFNAFHSPVSQQTQPMPKTMTVVDPHSEKVSEVKEDGRVDASEEKTVFAKNGLAELNALTKDNKTAALASAENQSPTDAETTQGLSQVGAVSTGTETETSLKKSTTWLQKVGFVTSAALKALSGIVLMGVGGVVIADEVTKMMAVGKKA